MKMQGGKGLIEERATQSKGKGDGTAGLLGGSSMRLKKGREWGGQPVIVYLNNKEEE